MKQRQREMMLERIRIHGEQLLTLFPSATVRDPDKLCRRLRRCEVAANLAAERACNVPGAEDEVDVIFAQQIAHVQRLLGTSREIIGDRHPSGYALKINLKPTEELHRDWGGYGIIAPDLRGA